ncbi:Serine/arginine repetitive matrix protein 1 [Glycine max]|nr:Serine/arginine repetitive matrix protein 1 [Glycine max]
MSGGFFRGTSADQDTRFSNKQAKLMKSQKFAPELEHLVDMTKVNMEVIKPWITRRVTELLGFEDEVLINFIHGLLDAKEVNGKEVQIQITGFMEKNTGKFMKELWMLLLSAQKNASGVPQQFLDAKEEELLKKKAESDLIASEIQRKTDNEDREIMEERLKKLDGGFDSKDNDTASDPTLKLRDSGYREWDGKETDKRNGVRARSRLSRSPHSPAVSISPHRGSPSRSMSKSFSNSRMVDTGQGVYLGLQRLKVPLFLLKGFAVLHDDDLFLLKGIPHDVLLIGGYLIQEDLDLLLLNDAECILQSIVDHHLFDDVDHLLLFDDIDRLLLCDDVDRLLLCDDVDRLLLCDDVDRLLLCDDVDHLLLCDDVDHLLQCVGVDHLLQCADVDHLPLGVDTDHLLLGAVIDHHHLLDNGGHSHLDDEDHLLLGIGHLHQYAEYRQPMCRIDQTPPCNPPPTYDKGMVVELLHSLHLHCNVDHLFLVSKDLPISPHRGLLKMNRVLNLQYGVYLHLQLGKILQDTKKVPCILLWGESESVTRQPSSPLGSAIRDKCGKASHYKSQDSMSTPEKSPIQSVSQEARSETSSEGRSPHESPMKQRRDKLSNEINTNPLKKQRTQRPSRDSPDTRDEAEETHYSRESRDPKMNSSQKISKHFPVSKRKGSPAKYRHEEFSPERVSGHPASEHHYDNNDWSKKGQEIMRDKSSGKGNEFPAQKSSMNKETFSREKPQESYAVDIKKSDVKDQSHSNYAKSSYRHHKSETTQDLVGKGDRVNHNASHDSVSEDSGKHRREGKDRKRHKRSEKKYTSSDEDYSDDSELEDRKEAKRRRKEEKKLQKEEKRRRCEEKRRRREERRAEKLKMKSKTDDISGDEEAKRMDYHQSDSVVTPSEQKKLEIELRNKALESLKAKKGMNN